MLGAAGRQQAAAQGERHGAGDVGERVAQPRVDVDRRGERRRARGWRRASHGPARPVRAAARERPSGGGVSGSHRARRRSAPWRQRRPRRTRESPGRARFGTPAGTDPGTATPGGSDGPSHVASGAHRAARRPTSEAPMSTATPHPRRRAGNGRAPDPQRGRGPRGPGVRDLLLRRRRQPGPAPATASDAELVAWWSDSGNRTDRRRLDVPLRGRRPVLPRPPRRPRRPAARAPGRDGGARPSSSPAGRSSSPCCSSRRWRAA